MKFLALLVVVIAAIAFWPRTQPDGSPTKATAPVASVAAPTVSYVSDAFIQKRDAIDKVDIKDLRWSKGSSIMEISLVFENKNDFDVKDIDVVCSHSAPSGTQIDSNRRTVYEVVPARGRKSIKDFNMGFIHSQAQRSSCSIRDLAFGSYRPQPKVARDKTDAVGGKSR